jgi:DNA gyrase/topoisomerase IV subunit B
MVIILMPPLIKIKRKKKNRGIIKEKEKEKERRGGGGGGELNWFLSKAMFSLPHQLL